MQVVVTIVIDSNRFFGSRLSICLLHIFDNDEKVRSKINRTSWTKKSTSENLFQHLKHTKITNFNKFDDLPT